MVKSSIPCKKQLGLQEGVGSNNKVGQDAISQSNYPMALGASDGYSFTAEGTSYLSFFSSGILFPPFSG
jgi:hypothetical protein